MASIVPAIITGGAQVAGAGIQSLGGKSAAKTQAKSQAAALDFAKQQEAARASRYNTAYSNWQQQVAQWNANRNALLQRYGMDIGAAPMTPVGAGVSQSPMSAPVSLASTPVTMTGAPQGGNMNVDQGQNLGAIIRARGADLSSPWRLA